MSISDFLNSEAGLTIVAGLVGTLWAVIRSRDWYRKAAAQRHGKAIRALEAGIEDVYQTYVKAVKQGRADGRLTDDEAAQARKLARRRAIALGRTTGVDVLRELGESYLELWISKLVRRAKRV